MICSETESAVAGTKTGEADRCLAAFACAARDDLCETAGYTPIQRAHGQANEGRMSAEEAGRLDGDGLSRAEPRRILAEKFHSEERQKSSATRLRHSTRQKHNNFTVGRGPPTLEAAILAGQRGRVSDQSEL